MIAEFANWIRQVTLHNRREKSETILRPVHFVKKIREIFLVEGKLCILQCVSKLGLKCLIQRISARRNKLALINPLSKSLPDRLLKRILGCF